MFVWWSSGNGGMRWGCCGGLMFLPLGFLFMSGFGDSNMLMLIALVALALIILPRLMSAQNSTFDKRKNDDVYAEKPKRDDERYILTDDGEIMPADEDDTGYLSK